ncbi:MAG: glycosyltransferase family 4 protein [Nitrospirae bacterium]|nr:glycosyltransferase family 4 protein [Nitrospirota bacterium]
MVVVANYAGERMSRLQLPNVGSLHIPIERSISPLKDLRALKALYDLFRKERFDIVHSVTPKAGLLAMVSALAAGIPLRFHTFTGQVWATRTGFFRWFLKMFDRIIYYCSTDVLVDSVSQRAFLLSERVIYEKNSSVLAQGSISGVDIQRFHPDSAARSTIRMEIGVPPEAFLFLFLGRLNREKGIPELLRAFKQLSAEYHNAYLLLVGPDEKGILKDEISCDNIDTRRIIYKGYTDVPEKYMAAADVFCLPSHREGFGSVIIEAAASGIPSIGSNIYGISDAIVDGITGLLHERQNVAELYNCLKMLMTDREKTNMMGNNARQRAEKYFSKDLLVKSFLEYYEHKINRE